MNDVARRLREHAQECRERANTCRDEVTLRLLNDIADDLEGEANDLDVRAANGESI